MHELSARTVQWISYAHLRAKFTSAQNKIRRAFAYGLFALVAMVAAAQPAYGQSCTPRSVAQNSTFTLAPFGVSGTVQKTAVAWQAAPNAWATLGGNYTIRWTFNQPVPAEWIQFGIVDIDAASPSAAMTVTLGGGSTATVAQLTKVSGELVLNGSGGVTRAPAGANDQSGQFRFNSTGMITSITITGVNISAGDNIANPLFVRPPCMTVEKVSEGDTGSFNIDLTNVAAANATPVLSTALTTTTAGTAVSSLMYFAGDTRTPITLSENVPAGWSLSSAVCTDLNAANSGNPSIIGTFASPTVTIPAANVRPEADIHCRFTNAADVNIGVAKALTAETGTKAGIAEAGETLTYQITLTNPGGLPATGYAIQDRLDANTTFVSADNGGVLNGSTVDWTGLTVPANGSLVLTVAVSVHTPLPAGVVRLSNIAKVPGDPDPACPSAQCVVTPVETAVTYTKSTSAANVAVGDVVPYTLTATVATSPTTGVLTLTDTLGAGLDFTAVTSAGAFTCNAANPLVCTLPAGTAVGTYSLTYTATVNASATGSVTNAVLGSGPDAPTCGGSCTTTTTLVAPDVVYAKTSNTAGPVQAGDVITYTLTTTVTNSLTTSDLVLLTDTLGTGIDFTAVTSPGAYTVDSLSAPIVRFTLPAGTVPGTYSVSYTATVNAQASGSVRNAVVGSGGDNPTCTVACGTTTSVAQSAVTYSKSAVAPAATVQVGDIVTYTLTATVSTSPTIGVLTLTDTLGAGLDFTAVTSAGAFTCNAANPLVCTLPAGTAIGAHSLTYTATVNASATGSVTNAVLGSGPDNPTCAGSCGTNTPLTPPSVTYVKSTSATNVVVGDAVNYTLTATVANSPTTGVLTLTDTLGAGLDFTAVTSAGAFTCNAANPLVCALPAGTAVGVYSLTYTTTVNASATGSVTNAVLGSGPDAPTCGGSCTTTTTLVAPDVVYAKTSNTAGPVQAGDVITYTLTTTVTNSLTTSDLVLLTDTLGTGIDFTAVTSPGAYTVDSLSAPIVRFTLPAGTVPGTYSVSYTATVNAQASGSVRNAVVGSGGDNPTCTVACGTTTSVAQSAVTYSKSAVAPAATVQVGDIVTYTLTATVSTSPTIGVLTLTDTLGAGLDFTAVTSAGAFTCNAANPLVCTLPAGTAVGAHSLTYTATVNASATGSVTNAVLGSGPDNPTCAGSCGTNTPVATPVISVAKSANPAAGETVLVGQVVRYALIATVANSPTTAPLVLVDTPDPGLTITSLPAPCAATGATITCTLPAGTPVGTHELVYDATINENAGASVRNLVTASGGGSSAGPSCVACAIEHKVELPQIRLVKTAAVRQAKIGDLIRYTLSVENVGERAFVDGSVIDTPPAGFTYVEGSLQVLDSDGAAAISGQRPLQFQGIDVAAGETATLSYLMRVGAGVRQGSHINQAQTYSLENRPVSNRATAQVELIGDPLIDETLVFGTVFDDRDGDGWQDNAALSGLHVQGGFAPDAYVPGSTTINRGQGMQPEPDASAPLLHGIKLGGLSARQSEADPAGNHRIVIRQRLNTPTFTDDFVLTNNQGVTIRMDAAGRASVEKTGDAGKGLNGAEPTVERRVAQGDGGYVVDYIVENVGIDERGIPGVRIASVEGLIIETDQFGRYHLEGIPGGQWERGRNFILKVDPATLANGATFTTDNPLLRRITPGIPVRFDWGVKFPATLIEGRSGEIELQLGKILFAAGSAEVRQPYHAVIDRMAAKLREHQGGEIVIDANGDTEAIAFERAEAVKTALLAGLDAETVRNLKIVARGKVDDPASLVVGIDEGGALLGTVLFATDSADISPQYEPLLDRIAVWLGTKGGGTIAIVGHADARGSFEYNTALGMRRARSVYEGLARRLPSEVRANVRVVSRDDPTTPVVEQSK
jgi:uncharacterized repeat protein (TIGR01451 family)/fimbrial isopeptide formation D2 family protein